MSNEEIVNALMNLLNPYRLDQYLQEIHKYTKANAEISTELKEIKKSIDRLTRVIEKSKQQKRWFWEK